IDERNLHRQECIRGMLDQFRAFGSGYDQWRRNPCPVGLRNGLRQTIVAPAGERHVDLPQERSAAFAISAYNDSIRVKKVNDRTWSNRLLQVLGKTQSAATMTLQQLGQKVLMNWNLTGIQISQLLLIVVNQDNFVAEVGETPPCHQSHVS